MTMIDLTCGLYHHCTLGKDDNGFFALSVQDAQNPDFEICEEVIRSLEYFHPSYDWILTSSSSESMELAISIAMERKVKGIGRATKRVLHFPNTHFGTSLSLCDSEVLRRSFDRAEIARDSFNLKEPKFDIRIEADAFVYEPIQLVTGDILTFSELEAISQHCINNIDAMTISNETFSSLGRCGARCSITASKKCSDMVIIGESLGQGFGISALGVSKELELSGDTDYRFHLPTPISCMIALRFLELLKQKPLMEHVAIIQEFLRDQFGSNQTLIDHWRPRLNGTTLYLKAPKSLVDVLAQNKIKVNTSNDGICLMVPMTTPISLLESVTARIKQLEAR